MAIYLLSILSVILFCFSAHGLMAAIQSTEHLLTDDRGFSKRALRIERNYRIFAFSVLTAFLFYSMLTAFIHAFTELPG